MSVKIKRLILWANTADGPYGLDIPFSDGLFILRVENSHGKSTCINSIAYALGMEMSLGQQTSKPPFPPSLLKSIQDKDGIEKLVISSHVLLEICNDRGEIYTLKRNILGSDADSIITVFKSEIKNIAGEGERFFLHREGDTNRDLGFYSWLANFIGWKLPLVPNNNGKEVPLYPSVLFPLFFIEQKKGWGSIQATTPFHFQIAQVKKRAFEFIMKMDVNDIVKKKAKNKRLINEAQERWKEIFLDLKSSIALIGGKINGVEGSPSAKFDAYKIDVIINIGHDWMPLSEGVLKYQEELKRHISAVAPKESGTPETEMREALQRINKELLEEEYLYESASDEAAFIENQVSATNLRIENLIDDKRKYEDLKKVKQFSSLRGVPVLDNECPTCGREYSDHSINLECSDDLMTLEESLDFIKSQIQTFKSVLHSYNNQLQIKSQEIRNIQGRMSRHEKSIHRIKEDLALGVTVLNEDYLREKIRIENKICELQEALVKLANSRNDFDKLHVHYRELLRLRKGFSDHGFTESDLEKLSSLKNEVIKNLSDFGFSSFDPDLLEISSDSYLPTREGFDLGFDTSASDGIRVIWSYLISLFNLRDVFSTNHPGLLIFDEPRQQEANKISFTGLLRGAADVSKKGQIIFATSEEENALKESLSGFDYTMLSFSPDEGKILRKL